MYTVTAELTHMAKKTMDPAKWREEALKFFSATHYQKAREFSDVLTASFAPGSTGAAKLRKAERCTLSFRAYGQGWDIAARVWKLSRRNPLAEATMAHNRLFNPTLHPETEILGFEPNWGQSREIAN